MNFIFRGERASHCCSAALLYCHHKVGPLTTAKAKHRNLVAGICPHTLMETDQGMSAAATIYFHGDFAESSAFAYYLSVRSAANGRLLHRRKFVRDAKTTDAYGAQQVTMNMPAALARGIRSGKPKALAAVESGIYMEVSVRRWLVRKTVIYRVGVAMITSNATVFNTIACSMSSPAWRV